MSPNVFQRKDYNINKGKATLFNKPTLPLKYGEIPLDLHNDMFIILSGTVHI